MKYEFCKHVGIENICDEKRLFNRMLEVLHYTGTQVNIHVLPKKDRHFLCPVALLEIKEGKLKASIVTAFSQEETEIKLSKSKMVQVIKKALKNYTRKKTCTVQEL
jgi:hypothetical protein